MWVSINHGDHGQMKVERVSRGSSSKIEGGRGVDREETVASVEGKRSSSVVKRKSGEDRSTQFVSLK